MTRTRMCAILVAVLTVLMGAPLAGLGQTRVDNPGRAMAKNAGRIIRLEEVQRIRDDGETAIFKSPRFFKLGPDGSLFFYDFAGGERLYRYGRDGKLLTKLLKDGQGPGECQHLTNYILAGDRVRALAWAPPKIMDFDPDSGRYRGESRVEEDAHGVWFLGSSDGTIYAIRDEVFSQASFQGGGQASIPNGVYEVSHDFATWKKIYEFPVHMLIKRRNAFRLDPIDASIGGLTLFVVHTAEYGVTALDLRSGRVKHVITRAYGRIKARPGKPEDADPEAKGVEFPEDPYVWDIDRIHAAAGKLWVFTSTMKADGNDQAVDVFDADGRYVDCFILRYPPGSRNRRSVARWTLLTDDGIFIIPEQEDDGLVSIGLYRLPDAGLFPAQARPRRTP